MQDSRAGATFRPAVPHPSRPPLKRRLSVALSALLLASVPACDQATTDEAPLEEIAVSCAGKCDGWSSIKSLWRDAKKLDLNDLLSVSAGYASEALNDALDFTDFASVKLSEPQLFALDADAKDDLTLHSIDELVGGLTRRFGDHELTTEVNTVRQAHLQNSDDKVFAEVAFTLGANLGHGWNIDTGDIGGLSVRLGFNADSNLEARIIGAYESELYATGGAPLTALRHARDFILPRSLDDKGNPDYESAVGRTLTEARAAAASALFDTLWEMADDLDPHPEAVVAYTLLALTPHDRTDLRLDVKMDLSDGLSQSFDHYRAAGWGSFDVYAKGAKVAPIDGGQFNIDALINVQ